MALFVLSCDKDFVEPSSQNENIIEIYNERKEVAKLFSTLMDDKVLVNNLIEECKKGFCNETEILFSKVLNIKTGNGNSVEDHFKNAFKYNIEKYINIDPLLCLYFFEAKDEMPSKISVYVDKVVSEHIQNEDVFYYENGIENVTKISNVPKNNVFVLKTNERTFAVDISAQKVAYMPNVSWSELTKDYYQQFGTINTDEENNYLLSTGSFRIYSKYKDQDYAAIKKEKNIGLRSCPTGFDRDCIDGYEVIGAMKWNDHREPWIKGGPEWIIRYSLGTLTNPNLANPQLSIYTGADQRYSMLRQLNSLQTKTDANIILTDLQLYRWRLIDQTKEAYFFVFEDDGGWTLKTWTLPSLKGTFKINIPGIGEVSQELSTGTVQQQWLSGNDIVGGVISYYENNWMSRPSPENIHGYKLIVGGNLELFCKERDF